MGDVIETRRAAMYRAAAAIGASEMALFSVDDGRHTSLPAGLHVRPDQPNPAERDAAVAAFKEMADSCVARSMDRVFEIVGSEGPDGCQFCLVLLGRHGGNVVGAAAFIVRVLNDADARAVLQTAQLQDVFHERCAGAA